MARNDNAINLGGAVWKPVPTGKNEPFAHTSRGSWTWPTTSAKEPDRNQNSVVGQTNAAPGDATGGLGKPLSVVLPTPVGGYGNSGTAGQSWRHTTGPRYDDFMANDRAQTAINAAADRYNSTFNPQVLAPTLPSRAPEEISRAPSPIASSWYNSTLWSTLPPPSIIEETLARQAAESGINLVPYTGPTAADLAQVYTQSLNQNFGYYGAGYHPEYIPPQPWGQPTILAQIEPNPWIWPGHPPTAAPVTLEEVPIENTWNPFEIIRRAVSGAIARADNHEPSNRVYAGGGIRGQDVPGTAPPVPLRSQVHIFRRNRRTFFTPLFQSQ